MTPEKFVEYVKKDVEKSSIKLSLVPKKWVVVEGGVRVNGFFDEEELAVAVNRPEEDWFPVLVHEYSHFRQWKDNCFAWRRVYINDEDVSDTLFLWVKHKKRFSLADVKLHSARTRDLEVDCERKTVDLIHKFKLRNYINPISYVMQANSYLYFYNYAVLRRKWWKRGHAPYANPDVWTNFPPFFMKKYGQLPQKYIELYDKYC